MEIENNIDKRENEKEQENQLPNPEESLDGRLDPEDAKFSNDQNSDEVIAKKQ